MIPHLTRLLDLWRIAAHYRLDTLFPAEELPEKARHVLSFIRMHPAAWSSKERKNPLKLKQALEDMGPLAIKLGQLLSTRRDLIPPEVLQQLVLLQDRVKPFGSDVAKMRIQESLKADINTLFARFDEQPLAAASIAQVHAAQLWDGKEVVVKVLRPGIEKIIRQDIEVMYLLADLVQRYWKDARRLRPVEIVAEYEKTIFDELDLMREAANASQVRRNFEGNPVLYVPEVHWNYTHTNVMVMERIYGVPVGDIQRLKDLGINFKRLGELGVEVFFTQVFRHNFFHADMHPGNIFVDATHPHEPQYMAVDFGIVGTLTPEDKRYLAENFYAFFNRDYKRVAELHVESGWVPANTRVDEFESAIRSVCEPIFNLPIKDISFGNFLLRLFQTARRFNMEVQPQLVLLQKTLLNIEGLGRQLYPDLDLWSTAKPFIERWMDEQVGVRALLNGVKTNLPKLLENLPHMPNLLHDVLKLTAEQRLKLQYESKQLERMQKELKRSQISTRFILAGGSLIIGGSILISSPTLMFDPAFVLLDWSLGLAGITLLVYGLVKR